MPTERKSPLLSEREFIITSEESRGGRLTWYTPTEHLKDKYPSVLQAELTDTTSSAGDWNGLLVQRQGRTVFVIPFSQENRWRSFVLNTGKPIARFPYRNWRAQYETAKESFLKSLYS